MAKRKKLEKKARKAYERAEEAIQKALKAAAKLDKKTKKKAASLSDEWAKAGRAPGGRAGGGGHSSDAGGGVATSDGQAAALDLTPPLPTVTDENAETAAEFAGSVASTAPHDPTLDTLTVQALRDVATSRGYRNVSRLTKAQLIERLSD